MVLEYLQHLINNVDILIVQFLYTNLNYPYINYIMESLTCFGNIFVWFVFCTIIYLIGGEKSKELAKLCILAVIFSFCLSESLKSLFNRPRPDEVLNINALTEHNSSSMPSGHSAVSFTIFTLLTYKYGYWWLFLGFSSLVALSRVGLGVHYPSDLIVGGIIGVLSAFLFIYLEKKYLLKNKTKQISNKKLNKRLNKKVDKRLNKRLKY